MESSTVKESQKRKLRVEGDFVFIYKKGNLHSTYTQLH